MVKSILTFVAGSVVTATASHLICKAAIKKKKQDCGCGSITDVKDSSPSISSSVANTATQASALKMANVIQQ